MFKLPELPSFNFPAIDFPSIDFSGLDLNALRESELGKRIAAIDTEKITAALRDAAYLTVGIGVVAAERVQATFESRMARIDERVDAMGARVDTIVDRIEGVLPEQAGHLVGQARDITRVARKQARGLVRNAA